MIPIFVPGLGDLHLSDVVVDFNGTLAWRCSARRRLDPPRRLW